MATTVVNPFLQFGGAGGAGGWVELGRTTLGSAGTDIDVTSLADKRYYQFLVDIKGTAAGIDIDMRMGNSTIDTGSNYAYRRALDGTEYTTTSTSALRLSQNAGTDNSVFVNGYIANRSAQEKLLISHSNVIAASGAGAAPNRTELAGKWTNTSNPLDVLSVFHASVNYDSGSELVVLGWDPTDTHTTNFWEPLASVDAAGGSATLSSGTFTAKKYLWGQIYSDQNRTGNSNYELNFNNDTGSNYSSRENYDGSGEGTRTAIRRLYIGGEIAHQHLQTLTNFFIINNSANEKLYIQQSISVDTTGAGTAPHREEVVGKWANTSSQITELDFLWSAGTHNDTSKLRIWGSD